jgi:fumarylacetoacetate (FAA) hydrolase family protein
MALSLDSADILPEDRCAGTLVGRAWLPGAGRSDRIPPWEFGALALMRNLAQRGLL